MSSSVSPDVSMVSPSSSTLESDTTSVIDSGASCIDSGASERETFNGAASLLSRLRAPRPSDLARKRKIITNPPSGKRKSRGTTSDSDPIAVTPQQRVSNEQLTVSCNKLFCRACREKLCLKSSSVKNHLKSKKHQEGKIRLQRKEAQEQDLAKHLEKYNKEHHPRGETLPESQQIKVVKTFLLAGVPLSKLDVFRNLLEETGYRLTDRRFMFDLIPFILEEEETNIKREIQGKHIGVIFDG